jgi:Pentapeptide repeats (8 copies)
MVAIAELTATPVIVAVCIAAVAAVFAIWLIPKRQTVRWARQGIKESELAQLENGARATLVQIVGGIALILTFAATWMQISDTRRTTERTLELTESQQEAERFTRAVEAVASDRLAVRLGGIFSLEQMGLASPSRRVPIVQLMAAYLKQHSPWIENDPRLLHPVYCQSQKAREEVQAALNVILRLGAAGVDLSRVNLYGVRARAADFAGMDLVSSQLTAADLRAAHFDVARLYNADLRGACLGGTRFGRARLGNTDFRGADLSGADLGNVLSTTPDPPILDLSGARTNRCTTLPRRERAKGC